MDPNAHSATSEQIEVRRHLDALRRHRGLIAAIALVATFGVLAASLVLPKTYQATARIVVEDAADPLGGGDAESVRRRLATTNALLTTPAVLDLAAGNVRGESAVSLAEKVESSIDPEADIIDVTARDGDAERTALIANSVARAFLRERRERERRQLRRARATLLDEIDKLRGRPDADAEVSAIRERVSQVGVREASAGSELQVAELAVAPTAPASPRPLRNAVLALFASLFVGVLAALGRDQLTPRVGSPRELGRLLGVPVLGGVPYVRRRRRARGRARITSLAEEEAYQAFRNTFEYMLPTGDEPRVVLVTSAVHDEGKTTVTASVGRALAQGGHRVLVVSGDVRRPRLDHALGLDAHEGMAELLAAADSGDPALAERVQDAVAVVLPFAGGTRRRGALHAIRSGRPAGDLSALVARRPVAALFAVVRRLDYDYVLVDAPPLLPIADGQVLAQEVDELLLVARVDRLTLENAADQRAVLDRLGVTALGVIALGAAADASPYYLARREAVADAAAPRR